MKAYGFRRILLTATSVLVFNAGVAMAQDESGNGGGDSSESSESGGGNGNGGNGNGGNGNGGNGNGGNGNGSGSGNGNGGNGTSGDGGSADGGGASGGDAGGGGGGGGASGGDAGGGGGGGGASGGDAGGGGDDGGASGGDAGGDGDDSGASGGDDGGGSGDDGASGGDAAGDGGNGDGGLGSGAVGSGPPPADNNESLPSTAEPAFQSAPSETVSAPDRNPTFSAEQLVTSLPPLREWSLADFSGKRVIDANGAGIGTVEGIVVDPANNLYLVTALDSQDVDGQERVIPLTRFVVDEPSQSLVLGQDAVVMLPTMADMAAVASAFMMVDSNEKLRSLIAAP